MECDEKMRKGHERRLWGAVLAALARAAEADDRLPALERAQQSTEAEAERACQQIQEHFALAREHKTTQLGWLQQERKRAHQAITDAFMLCLLLRRIVRGQSGTGETLATHVAWGLAVRATGRPTCLRVQLGATRNCVDRWIETTKVDVWQDRRWVIRGQARRSLLAPLRPARSGHASAVTSSGLVVVCGGTARLRCECLDLRTGLWHDFPSFLPTARENCGACAVGNAVVVVGGFSGGVAGTLGTVEALDTPSGVWTALPHLPVKVSGCGVAESHGTVFVVGGTTWGSFHNTAWALDVGKDLGNRSHAHWRPLPRLRSARATPGTAAGDGHVFVCGGDSRNGALWSCETLAVGPNHTHGPRWQPLTSLPVAITSPGCCYGGGHVFVAGGLAPHCTGSVWALAVGKGQWSRVGELVFARFACTAVCVGRCVLVLGGTNEGRERLASCELLEF